MTSMNAGSSEDEMPVSAAGQPKPISGKGHAGDGPATWHLPIEAYLPSTAEVRLIAGTRDGLIDQCMKSAGYDAWTPAPDLPEVGGKTLVDWRYGIHDPALAAARGYKPAAEEQAAYDQAVGKGAVDESGADPSVLKGCVQQADGTVPASRQAPLAQQISGESYKESMKDPAVVSVFAKWSACMADKGYAYQKPMDANDDVRFADPHRVSAEEKDTAKADVACREKNHVEKTWFDAEAALQKTAIKAHQKALNEVKAANKSAAAKAASAVK
ncbi:hypothetical protein ACIQU1_19575 [Streptomyces angustmyceticus]|uniref:hypothetical protein n=1 Tax=Streptomyces angustmyceticus TaxID=285578 RepID=UPI00344C46CF